MNRTAVAVFLTAFSASFLMFGYELIRSSANSLLKAHYGNWGISGSLAFTPLSLMSLLMLYNLGISKLGPKRTLLVTMFASPIVMLIGAWSANGWGAVLCFLVREAYVVILVEQFWSFITSIASTDQLKRWNGPIIGISSMGAIAGAVVLGLIAKQWSLPMLITMGCFFFVPSAFLSMMAYRFASPERLRGSSKIEMGIGEVFRHRTLTIILLMVVCSQVLSTCFELVFQDGLSRQFPDPGEQTAHSAWTFAWINAISCALQFLVVPVLLLRVSGSWVQLGLPLIHVTSAVAVLCIGDPRLYTGAYVLFKSLDYSVFRATKELMYVPLDFNIRFRSKEWIDVFGYRVSRGVAAGAVSLLQLASDAFVLAAIALGAAMIWLLGVVAWVAKPRER